MFFKSVTNTLYFKNKSVIKETWEHAIILKGTREQSKNFEGNTGTRPPLGDPHYYTLLTKRI
jgi:hypothetical protein